MLSSTGLTFADDDQLGFYNLQLRLRTNLGDAIVAYDEADDRQASGTVLGKLQVRTTAEPINDLDAILLQHTLTNTGIGPIWVSEAATGAYADDAAVKLGKTQALGWDLRFAHTDNVRTESYPHCQQEYPYLRMLPLERRELGRGEDQAFPAIYLQEAKAGRALIAAAGSQALNYLVFRIRKGPFVQKSILQEFELIHDFRQADGLQIQPGASVTLDSIYLQRTHNTDLNTIFHPYIDHLAGRFHFRGDNHLCREAIHCTWNYGVFAEQEEAPLLKTATFIAENLPGIKYFLMDAGYLVGDIATTFLDRFYPDPEQHVSAEIWPDGIRGFSDKLRALGLKPGIWWSPTCQVHGQLYQEHPDWFMRKRDGGLYLIGEKNACLDYTHPEACHFLDRTLAHILGTWNFDACKMDFWSQGFESPDIRLHDPTQTALQTRKRFFDIVRKHLPDDGIFMTCVAVGMGNPFVGQFAETYRNTIDIGIGQWHEQRYNCSWALPTLTFPGRKTYLLNNDSVGANLNAPEHENIFRFTWSFMNQGIIETGGRMEQWPEKYIELMRRCTTHIDRGHPVRCADPQAFTGEPYPQVLTIDYPADSATRQRGVRKHIALFNWDDVTQVVGAGAEQLGLEGPVTLRNFWTDERITTPAEGINETLPPRTARLYELSDQ